MSPPTPLPDENTVLFLDLIDSTRLYEHRGDRQAFSIVTACLGRASAVILEHGGRIVKYTGDGLMAAFPGPDVTAAAVLDIHDTLRDCPSLADKPTKLRVGFHCGPLLKSGTDIFGETVNIAARIADLASAGRALTTATTAAQMDSSWRARLTAVPARIVRGIRQPLELFELRCDTSDEATSVFGAAAVPGEHSELRLYLNRRWTTLNRHNPQTTLGRAPSADVCIDDARASRHHAAIELRGDKFVLVDHSSNGTYVTIGNTPEFIVSHEDIVLHGGGWISLGRSRDGNPCSIEFFGA